MILKINLQLEEIRKGIRKWNEGSREEIENESFLSRFYLLLGDIIYNCGFFYINRVKISH